MTEAYRTTEGASAWLPYRQASQRPAARLFCLPCAGGTARMFLSWRDHLPPWLELCAVQLPGRERRISEPLPTSLDEVVAEFLTNAEELLDIPYVLFGHSMGGLLCYEIASALERHGCPLPTRLYVSAARPPSCPGPFPPMDQLSDEELVRHLLDAGGTPDGVFTDPALSALLLPIFRADLRLCEADSTRQREPLGIPVTALAASGDRVAPQDMVSQWRQYTSQGFQMKVFSGEHFFIHNELPAVVEMVARDVGRDVATYQLPEMRERSTYGVR